MDSPKPKRKKRIIHRTAHPRPSHDFQTKRTMAEIGEEELRAMLESRKADDDKKAEQLLDLMSRPPDPKTSIMRLMQLAGYTRREMVKLYGEYKADEMQVRLARGLPDLATDLVEDAKSRERTCGACKGAGMIIAKPGDDPLVGAVEETCVECSGAGKIRERGCNDSRKLILEVSGLVKKGNGFGVNINMGNSGNVDSFDTLISRANDLMDDKRTVNASAEQVGDEPA